MSLNSPSIDLNGLPSPSISTSTTTPLDHAKLTALPAEQQDLYLLSYLSDLERTINSFDADGATAHQFFVKRELFKIISLPAPAPTRVTREIIGRCLAQIFGLGDRKLLFECINELAGLLGGVRGEKEMRSRHCAAHCLGEVFRTAGDSALSLAGVSCGALLKLLKPAQNHAGLRSTIFRSLAKIFKLLGPSTDESIARDVWKQARNVATTDKSVIVQAAALKCMEELAKETQYFESSNEFERLKTTVFKVLETAGTAARHAAASCLASALVSTYTTDETAAITKLTRKPTKKMKRQSTIIDDEPERPGTPTSSGKKATKVIFTLEDLLRQLSTPYVKTATTAKARAGIIQCYAEIFVLLGSTTVETNYGTIINHLLTELLSAGPVVLNRFRLLTTRKHVKLLLEDIIGARLLGEAGQFVAIRYIVNEILKNYPAVVKERPEPTKYALVGALSALTALLQSLGPSLSSAQDIIRDGLLQVVGHPSYSVQINSAWCLRAFVLNAPSQLLPVITICMNNTNRELGLLANKRPTSESFRKCTGFANAMAAVISTAPLQPLYASIDITSRILTLATTLLKSSGDFDLRISSTQIQVAWFLIGGLMSLGPNFVKIHLSQLLLLWKNALPKPLAKDSMLDRSLIELSFLAHVRECALGAILSFLEFNPRLVTTDVAKRIAAMLQNSTLFLNALPQRKQTDDVAQKLSPSLNLLDFDLMVRRRIMQCNVKLVKLSQGEALQANLLTIATSFFADPEKYTPSSLSTQIQSAGGGFEGLWDVADGYAYGVCSLVKGLDVENFAWEEEGLGKGRGPGVKHWTTRNSVQDVLDRMLDEPILGAIEHDSVCLYTQPNSKIPYPAPPATEVVNTAIDLFAVLLPSQPPKVQESILEQITNFLAAGSLQRDPGRKAAMTVNIAVALLGTVKLVQTEIQQAQISWRQSNVLKIVQDLLQGFVVHPDAYVRNLAYEAMGRLCSIGGNIFTGNQIKYLIDTVVANRDPNARAGCAVALGCINSYVGGMAAGLHLKTILGILMSLANDPHPTVHFWSLDGLARTIDSAGLTFSGYVSSTLGMLAQLYVGDSHDREVANLTTGNAEDDLDTTSVIVRCVDSLVGVLGPDLMHMTKPRELILTLVGQFFTDPDPVVLSQALRSLEHLSLFAAASVDMKDYIKQLQRLLVSADDDLKAVAIDGIYQAMKGNAQQIMDEADEGLDETLWETLDNDPQNEGIKNLIKNWLSQTTIEEAGVWVDRCQRVMTKLRDRRDASTLQSANNKSGGGSGGMDLQDEEVAGFATAATTEEGGASAPAPGSGQEPMRWQVRTFSMECLQELLSILSKKGEPGVAAVMENVAEVIKMAFSASTGSVVELRIRGLKVVDQVLKLFGRTPDPDFPEAMLLEQYQAQIGSALTPAFATDSSPELAAEAVNVCAVFISTGIVKDVDRMGRILKLLTSSLENFSVDSENASIGDLKGLSYNAQVMVKMAILCAWAELQVASSQQAYLVDVVKPHIVMLAPMWLASLREFARLRFEPDISMNGAGNSGMAGSLDMVYSSLSRDVLLKFYQDSWLNLVDAIASLIEQDSQFVFDALDGKASTEMNGTSSKHDINYRDEPVAFFFVLFGIAFEALAGRPGGSDSLATKEQILEVLLALKKILHPSVCGHAIYQDAIFSETVDLLDRLVLTEGIDIQLAIVGIVRSLCITHPSARKSGDANGAGGENLSEDINQLFELTRLIVLVLAGQLGNLTDGEKVVRGPLSEQTVVLIRASLEALVDAAEVFPSVIKMDLYASILHIFATIFSTGACQSDVVPKSLPIFKRFMQTVTKTHDTEEVVAQLRGTMFRLLEVIKNARKLNTESSMLCIRNCLMAIVMVLTSGTNLIPPNDPLLPRVCDEMLAGLQDSITLKTAVLSCRSILLYQPKNETDLAVVRNLLPRIVRFVATDEVKEVENSKGLMAQVLMAFMGTLDGDSLQTAMTVYIPAFLSRAAIVAEPAVYKDTAARLMEMVSRDQGLFKGVMLGLSAEQRGFMEEILRAGAGSGAAAQAGRAESAAPTIALKMTF